MYSRYESGYQNFETVQRNTLRAKLNFNEYLVQIFPNVEGKIQENLIRERESLVKGLKDLEQGRNFIKKSSEYMVKLEKYEGMNLDDIKKRREEFEQEIFKSREKLRDITPGQDQDYLQHIANKYDSYDALKGMVAFTFKSGQRKD